MRVSAIALVIATVLLAGCGGGKKAAAPNGEASKSAAQVLTDAKTATLAAKSVRLSGTIHSSGKTISLDITIAQPQEAKGSMKLGGASLSLVVTGGKAYIQASDAFYKQFAGAEGAAIAQLLHGKWLEASATSGQLASLAELTSIDKLFAQVASTHDTLKNDGETTYQGQKAVAIRDTTQGGTLYVAATGTAYPIALVGTGKNQGTIAFSDWNASVSIAAPKGAIDLSKLGAG